MKLDKSVVELWLHVVEFGVHVVEFDIWNVHDGRFRMEGSCWNIHETCAMNSVTERSCCV